MSDIFLSYSSEDKGRVQALARVLERKGWSVWWDRRIPVGRSYADVIEEALDASKTVVVVWTTTSVKSQWVKNEALEGLNRRVLFPVMLEAVKIPLEFRHVQAARLMDWQPDQEHAGFDQFIDDLVEVIGVPSSAGVQQPPATRNQEPLPSSTFKTPEPELPPGRAHRAEPVSRLIEQESPTATAQFIAPASPIKLIQLPEETEVSDIGQLSMSPTPDMGPLSGGTDQAESERGLNEQESSSESFAVLRPTEVPSVDQVSLSSTPETESLPDRESQLEAARKLIDQKSSSMPAHSVPSETQEESCSAPETTEAPKVDQASAPVDQDRQVNRLPNVPPSQTPASFLIGGGLLAAIGAFAVYWIVSSSASPIKREPPPYREYLQTQPTQSQVITPPPVREPSVKLPRSTTPPKPTMSQGTTGTKAAATKSRQTASPSKTEEPSSQVTDTTVEPAAGPPKTITGKDGASMVLVSGGSFHMGITRDEVDREVKVCMKERDTYQTACESRYEDELPQHQVDISAFYLDKYEVTNRLFQQFVQQTGHRTIAEQEGSAKVFVEGKGWEDVKEASWRKPEAGANVFDSNRTEHPVVSVTWDDARAYCRWTAKRLPTEAEFEYAMRAGTTTTYWWGEGNPGSRRVENVADEAAKLLLKKVMSGYNDGIVRTAPVGSYEANPWGLYDMSGNVVEWTADWYGRDYYGESPSRNPKGPSSGERRVIRGGSWGDGPGDVRSATRGRLTPAYRLDTLGVRCAQDVPK